MKEIKKREQGIALELLFKNLIINIIVYQNIQMLR